MTPLLTADTDELDPLRPSRGIVCGLAISAALWLIGATATAAWR